MKEYFKVATVYPRELNSFLDSGWEIIETTKERNPDGEFLRYNIGFPLKSAFEIARNILMAYDKHELRQQLLEAEAKEIGEDLEDYGSFTGSSVKNSLVSLLEGADFVLSASINPKYYKSKKSDNNNIEIDF